MNNRINEIINITRSVRLKRAKELAKQPKVKFEIKGIKQHFRTDKWPLCYLVYAEFFKDAGCEEYYFTSVLQMNGFKVVHDKKEARLYIKQEAKSNE